MFQSEVPFRGDVLVVEDEPMLLDMLRRVLDHAGFRSTLARDADEAFAGLAAHGSTFCAAYLDLTLPGVSGAQVLARMRAEHPTLPVVLSSGRDYRTIAPEVLAMATVLLPKPYDLGDLVGAIEGAARSMAPR